MQTNVDTRFPRKKKQKSNFFPSFSLNFFVCELKVLKYIYALQYTAWPPRTLGFVQNALQKIKKPYSICIGNLLSLPILLFSTDTQTPSLSTTFFWNILAIVVGIISIKHTTYTRPWLQKEKTKQERRKKLDIQCSTIVYFKTMKSEQFLFWEFRCNFPGKKLLSAFEWQEKKVKWQVVFFSPHFLFDVRTN